MIDHHAIVDSLIVRNNVLGDLPGEEELVRDPEFVAWPKTARLNRQMVVTEKIDGTNAAVIVAAAPYGYGAGEVVGSGIIVNLADELASAEERESGDIGWRPVLVAAQSRKRVISPEQDNFGFARWVRENASSLAVLLGGGYHFGEWYGSGIQRGYGLSKGEKRFMLFNADRWEGAPLPAGVEVATVLYRSDFSTLAIDTCVNMLRLAGSQHVPGFDRPEGIVAYHKAANVSFKVTLEGDGIPKGLA